MSIYQKYRPRHFRDVVGQDEITGILKNQVARHETAGSYLFTGPSGVGKTSVARILAMALNCKALKAGEPCLKCVSCDSVLRGNSWDHREYDAATFRGIDSIRDLTAGSMFAPAGNFKVFIIDEAHALSQPAWDALLRLLEEPAARTKTILCTTAAGAVPATARSRCQLFEFATLSKGAIFGQLAFICKRERWGPSAESLRFIASMAQGNLRTALTMLEQSVNLNHHSPNIRQVKRFWQGRLAT